MLQAAFAITFNNGFDTTFKQEILTFVGIILTMWV